MNSIGWPLNPGLLGLVWITLSFMVCLQNHSHRAFFRTPCINPCQRWSWKGLYWYLVYEDACINPTPQAVSSSFIICIFYKQAGGKPHQDALLIIVDQYLHPWSASKLEGDLLADQGVICLHIRGWSASRSGDDLLADQGVDLLAHHKIKYHL